MESKMSILFYGKKSKNYKGELLPIYMRVTIQSRRLELSCNYSIEPARWNSAGGKVKGNSEESRTINTHLYLGVENPTKFQLKSIPLQRVITPSLCIQKGTTKHAGRGNQSPDHIIIF